MMPRLKSDTTVKTIRVRARNITGLGAGNQIATVKRGPTGRVYRWNAWAHAWDLCEWLDPRDEAAILTAVDGPDTIGTLELADQEVRPPAGPSVG